MKSVLDYIQRNAVVRPEALAFVNDARSVTYAELLARAAAYRDCALAAGISSGNRVGMALSDDIEMMAAILGTWACQATAVPIDFRNRKTQRKATYDAFNLDLIFEDQETEIVEYKIAALEDQTELSIWNTVTNFELAPAFIAVTSGTSGQPSGIVISHSTYCHRLEVYNSCYQISAASNSMLLYPISFSASRTSCVMTLMYGGGNCIAPFMASGDELVDFIKANEITNVYLVPVTLQAIIETGESLNLKSLRCIQFGSAPAADDLKSLALSSFRCELIETYSATSTGGLSFHRSASMRERPETVGKIFAGVEVEIVDGNGNPLAPDQVGLIRTRGPALITEVIGGHTGGDFLKDGWAYPGDLGSIGADGFLTLAGRRSEMIVRGGEKIYPLEIEAVLLAHPNISDAAVVAIPHPTLGEQVVALVCLAEEQKIQNIRSHCINRLHGSKVPTAIKSVAKIPRNANGKILRQDSIKLFLETPQEFELT